MNSKGCKRTNFRSISEDELKKEWWRNEYNTIDEYSERKSSKIRSHANAAAFWIFWTLVCISFFDNLNNTNRIGWTKETKTNERLEIRENCLRLNVNEKNIRNSKFVNPFFICGCYIIFVLALESFTYMHCMWVFLIRTLYFVSRFVRICCK